MSWSQCFPIFDDEMVSRFSRDASDREKAEMEELFGIERIINPKPHAEHLVSSSLFWKRDVEVQDLGLITREMMENAEALGLQGRFPPWRHYVTPLLEGADLLRRHRKDASFRVYLANDLSFLIDDLVEAGCEIYLMMSSSICHNPGAMWRFLALEDQFATVTVTDADRARNVLADVERSIAARKADVGGWRVAYVFEGGYFRAGYEGYRPMIACQFGTCVAYPMIDILKSFVWHSKNGLMRDRCILGDTGDVGIFGTRWPDFGFDEWFLLAAIYPRMACAGLLTFIPWNGPPLNQFFALDIEYVTWANQNSEIVFFQPESRAQRSGIEIGAAVSEEVLA